jgi:hypothetical protein
MDTLIELSEKIHAIEDFTKTVESSKESTEIILNKLKELYVTYDIAAAEGDLLTALEELHNLIQSIEHKLVM